MDDDATLQMLRRDLLPMVAAVLQTHLGAPNATLPTHELHDALDAELDAYQDYLGISGRSAKAHCDEWRESGLLERRIIGQAREEVYALTPAARQGLRLVEQLLSPRASVTESRLVSLLSALRNLAVETDPNVERRLETLRAERDRLSEQIDRIAAGEEELLDDRQARERVHDVLGQAADLPTDFARVRTRFDELNRELRVRILTDEGLPREVLDNVFRGVDVIESSEEGKTFAAFSRMVRDPAMAESFEEDVRAVLSRDFAEHLPSSLRADLRALPRILDDGAREVQDTLTEFARGLRSYVLSQEYQRDRRLHATLKQALSAAAAAAPATRPFRQTGRKMELTGMSVRSIGVLTLHDPREFDVGPALADAEVAVVDVEALRLLARETEIDFDELRGNVNAALDQRAAGRELGTGEEKPVTVTVADVLAAFPATQGVASVVGLLSLAARYGTVVDDGSEDILHWRAESGEGEEAPLRSARVRRHTFVERLH